MTESPDQEPENPNEHGTSEHIGYRVEARYMGNTPIAIGPQLFDTRWRQVEFRDDAPVGIPRHPRYHRELIEHHLYNYEAAQALRWWIVAVVAAMDHMPSMFFETRLIQHSLKSSYTIDAGTPVDELTYRDTLNR
ncbi:MAG: hypothetical protein ACYCOU_01320 [Sulfobacillus sp.]